MNTFLRLGGAALVAIGALFVSKEYEKYLVKRGDEYRGLLALLSHAEGQISKFLAYGSALWRNFDDESLERCGLLPELRDGKGLSEAFEVCAPKMSLPRAVVKEISKSLSSLGNDYLEGELSALREIRERLTELLKNEEEQREKNIKVVRALLLGGALCAIILAL
jgi:hypothetical protein